MALSSNQRRNFLILPTGSGSLGSGIRNGSSASLESRASLPRSTLRPTRHCVSIYQSTPDSYHGVKDKGCSAIMVSCCSRRRGRGCRCRTWEVSQLCRSELFHYSCDGRSTHLRSSIAHPWLCSSGRADKCLWGLICVCYPGARFDRHRRCFDRRCFSHSVYLPSSTTSSFLSPLSLPSPRPFHCSTMPVSPVSDLERSEGASDEKNASYTGHAPVYVGENGEADAVEFVEVKDLR